MGQRRGSVNTHSRRTQSGGTTTVRQHTRRYTYAEEAARLFDSRKPKDRRRAWRLVGLVAVASIVWAITATLAGVGEALVVSSFTVVAVLLADNWKGARKAWRTRPRYLGPRARMHHFRVRAAARYGEHLARHPIQARAHRLVATRWDDYGRKYTVVGRGPAGPGGVRARTERTVRGKRRVSELDARAQAQGWTTTYERAR